MKKIGPIVLIVWLAIGSACAVIAGKEEDSGQQTPGLNLRFVESLRSVLSLAGESWREPQSGTPATTSLQLPRAVYADSFRVYGVDEYNTATSGPRILLFDRGEQTVTILDFQAGTKTVTKVAIVAGKRVVMSQSTPLAAGTYERLVAPAAIAVDPTNVIFVADSLQGRVFGYDRNGTLLMVLGRAGILGKPTGLAIDHARGRIYVADAADHQVKVVATVGAILPAREVLFTIGGSGKAEEDFKFPAALALDRAGNLYVLDSRGRRVHVYDPDGKFIRRFSLSDEITGSPIKPTGVAVDSDGHVYVTDMVSNNVLVFDRDGVLVQTWGRTGSLIGDFRSPAGIFIDKRDTVYVADQLNGRVQVFQYSK